MSRSAHRLTILLSAVLLAGCGSGDGLGVGAPAPAACPGSLARAPLAAMQPTATSVGPANTGPAGSAASVGDGTAVLGGH